MEGAGGLAPTPLGRIRCRRLAALAVFGAALLGPSMAQATASDPPCFPDRPPGAPQPPAGVVELVEYRFESDEIDGDVLLNTLEPATGWLNGQIFGEPVTVAGYGPGQALELDGWDDYIEIPETWKMTFRHGLFLEVKMKIEALAGDGTLLAKWFGGDQWGMSAHPEWGLFGAVDFAVRLVDAGTPEGVYHTVEHAFPDASYVGEWITLTGIYDPAQGLQLFVDGDLVASEPVTGMVIPDGYVAIHVGDGGNDWSRFEGAIDDVRICGDFTPAPRDAVRLIDYGFNEGSVVTGEVDNLVVDSVPWMNGKIQGGQPIPGVTGELDDTAWRFNLPWDESWVDYVEVHRGDYLSFNRGILVDAKIFLEEPLVQGVTKNVYLIATQLPGNSSNATSHWRLAIDWIKNEGYNLTFILYFEDGTSPIVKYPLPEDHWGDWFHVAGAYDPFTGVMALFWDYDRVAVLDVGQRELPTIPDPIRIGRGGNASLAFAFEGGIDDVRIWGDYPGCHRLTIAADPPEGGVASVTPAESRVDEFCGHDGYATGEELRLEASPAGGYIFYKWQGVLSFLGRSEPHKNPVDITLPFSTSATARLYHESQAPPITTFPVDGEHNTGHDDTCDSECDYGDEDAGDLSNDDCHGGVDIFAPLGTPVVAVQDGDAQFACDDIGGVVAYLFYPSRSNWQFAFYYAHLDGVCFRNAVGQIVTNPCDGITLCEDYCDDCDEDESCAACCQTDACQTWMPQEVNTCPQYFQDDDPIQENQILGWVGSSGNAACTSHHLHFGIYEPGWVSSCENMNPYPFLYALETAAAAPPPEWLFGDGFESGDTSSWSSDIP